MLGLRGFSNEQELSPILSPTPPSAPFMRPGLERRGRDLQLPADAAPDPDRLAAEAGQPPIGGGGRRYRCSSLYQREGQPGFGVYDNTEPVQAAALRLCYVLLGEGFPAVAMVSVVGR